MNPRWCLLLAFTVLAFAGLTSAIDVDVCQTLAVAGTYVLNQSVSSTGTCMNVTAQNVTLDCAGFGINFSSASQGYGVASNSTNTTVKNCGFINNTNSSNAESYAFGAFQGVTINAVNSSFNKSKALSAGSEFPDYGATINGVNMTGVTLLYHFNETSGAIIDYSGNDYNGTNIGADYGASGILNTTALNYVYANSDWVNSTRSDYVIPNKNAVTMSAWFKTSKPITNTYVIGTQRVLTGTAGSFFSIGVTGTTTFTVRYIYPKGTTVAVGVGSHVINDGEWHHVVFIKNNNLNVGYVDGELDFSATEAFTVVPVSRTAGIGGLDGNVDFCFNGTIDEVAVWSRVLSLEEVQHIYEVQKEAHNATNDALNVSWYADVHTTDDLGADLGSVNVNVSNVNGTGTVNFTSNASGWFNQLISEYFQNASGIYNATPHGFNATKSGYVYNASNYSIDSSQVLTIALTASSGAVAPNVTLSTPVNGSWFASKTVQFNYTPTDDGLFSNCTTELYYQNNTFLNDSNWNATVVANNSLNAINFSFAFDGSYLWNVRCYDNETPSLSNNSVVNWTVNVDSTSPSPVLGSNPVDDYNSSSSSVVFDFGCSDSGNVSAVQLWVNFTGVWAMNYSNYSYSNATWLNVTVAGIIGGSYVWGVYCNDSAGNSAWSAANRSFLVDLTAPSVVIDAPVNGSSYSSTVSLTLNVTASDSGVGLREAVSNSTLWAGVFSPSDNYFNLTNTTTLSAGVTCVNVTVNDSVGNSNYSYVCFTLTAPSAPYAVNVTRPNNNTWVNQRYLNLTGICNSSTTPFVNVTLNYNTSSVANSSAVLNGTAFNFNQSVITDGWYWLNVTCYSTNALSNTSDSIYLKVDSVAPSVSLVSPVDGNYSNSATVPFSFNFSDALSVTANCSLFLNGSYNQSNATAYNATQTNFSVGLSDGNWTWNVSCFDLAGNWASSVNRWVLVDIVAPSGVSYVAPTPANSSWRNLNWSVVNASFTETNFDSCTLVYVYPNSTTSNLSMTRLGNYCSFNVSYQTDGQANFTVYVNDSAGNVGRNVSYYRYFTDTVKPSVNITSPANGSSFYSNASLTLNVTAIDAGSGISIAVTNSSYWSSVFANTSSTAFNLTNTSAFAPQSSYCVNVTVNDSAGNSNYSFICTQFNGTVLGYLLNSLSSPANNSGNDTLQVHLCFTPETSAGFLSAWVTAWSAVTGALLLNNSNSSAIVNASQNCIPFNFIGFNPVYWSATVVDNTTGQNATGNFSLTLASSGGGGGGGGVTPSPSPTPSISIVVPFTGLVTANYVNCAIGFGVASRGLCMISLTSVKPFLLFGKVVLYEIDWLSLIVFFIFILAFGRRKNK